MSMQEHCILLYSCFIAQLYVMSTGTTAHNYGNPYPTIELHNSFIEIRDQLLNSIILITEIHNLIVELYE